MNELRSYLLVFLLALFAFAPLSAQEEHYCKNLAFELGNFTNWTGYTWIFSRDEPQLCTSPVQGFVSRRHTIMSDTTAYDANTGYALKLMPPGYMYSARLGDMIIKGTDRNSFRCWNQSLRYTTTIDSSNALLVLKFAMVLQYIANHVKENEPHFKLTLYDKSGNMIPDCANYDVYATNTAIKGFKMYQPAGSNNPIQWRDWTTVGANLMKYYGQTITIEIMATDCAQHFHYGYAYFIAECHPMYITVKFCAGDTVADLTAPEGFESYSWTYNSEKVVGTERIFEVRNPLTDAIYTCKMVSATGCEVSLQAKIARYLPKANFNSYMLDCKSNSVQFTNLSTKTNGKLTYLWDFGEGRATTITNPKYTFATSGLHSVTLEVYNPPSSCTDVLTKDVESFSPPLVGITGDSTYCPGKNITIKAYGAVDYTWNTGSKAETIEIGHPGGTYWLIGRSSTGCVSDTIYKAVIEEPEWKFLPDGDTILCKGSSVSLSVSGDAVHYFWNTKDTLSTIMVNTAGKYTVSGVNRRGCEKYKIFNVVEYPLPKAEFTIVNPTLDRRHSQVSCTVTVQDGVTYTWDMGDGSIETGSEIQHNYQVSNSTLLYTILLEAIDKYGCVDTSSQIIDVFPFIPNVFSPNDDGINDVFMASIDLQIFDRNGAIVYKGTKGWDGRHKGKQADPDTYFYLIYYIDRKFQIHTRKGYVTLVR